MKLLNKRKNIRKLPKAVLLQILLILGFVFSALTEEVIYIVRTFVLQLGTSEYTLYSVLIFLVWCLVASILINVVRNVVIEFRLSNSNPVGDIVPRGAIGVAMMSFDLSAPDDSFVSIKELIVSHTGDSTKDIEAIYLSINGARVSSVQNFNSDNQARLQFSKPISIKSREVVTVDVNVDFSLGAGAGNRHRLFIKNDDCLKTNAHTTIGAFPAKGAWFNVGKDVSGLITIKYKSSVGENTIGCFSISADTTEDQLVFSMTLKNDGTLTDEDIKNIYLADAGGKKMTDIRKQTVGNFATLIFLTPLTINKGDTIDLYIKADVASSGSIKMYFEERNDIFAVCEQGYGKRGQMFGSPVRIENSPQNVQF